MKTLRAKIAFLLVGAIVSVVALITVAMMTAFRPPTTAVVDKLAAQLVMMERLAKQNPESAILSRRPASGAPDQQQTELLRAATRRLGVPLDVAVTHNAADRLFRTASVAIGPRSPPLRAGAVGLVRPHHGRRRVDCRVRGQPDEQASGVA
jgi:hypothetical protein